MIKMLIYLTYAYISALCIGIITSLSITDYYRDNTEPMMPLEKLHHNVKDCKMFIRLFYVCLFSPMNFILTPILFGLHIFDYVYLYFCKL